MTYSPDQHMVDPRNPANWDDTPEPNKFYINPNQFSDDEYEDVHKILVDAYDNESDARMDAFGIARLIGKNVTIDVGYEDSSVEWFDTIVVKPVVKLT